jgi:hypothetical protein
VKREKVAGLFRAAPAVWKKVQLFLSEKAFDHLKACRRSQLISRAGGWGIRRCVIVGVFELQRKKSRTDGEKEKASRGEGGWLK